MFLQVLALLCLFVSTASQNPDFHGWINEFHYRNYQEDLKQFIEVIGPNGIEGWQYLLVMYQGRNGSQFHDGISLSGQFFIQETGVTGDHGFIYHEFHRQHGNIRKGKKNGDALALVYNGACVQFICYGDNDNETFTATTGPCYGETCTNIGVHEPRNNPYRYSVQMEGTGRYMRDFTWHPEPIVWTPGTINTNQTLINH